MDTEGPKVLYKLRIEGNGLVLEREIPEIQLKHVLNIVLGSQEQSSTSKPQHSQSNLEPPSISLREYLDEVNATRNPEIILAIAHYLVSKKSYNSVNPSDIKGLFKDAGEPTPANFPRDLNLAKIFGWIAEDHADRGNFYVTTRGKELLEKKFPADLKKSFRQKTKRKGKKIGDDSFADDIVGETAKN